MARRTGAAMIVFISVFLIATFAVSQLTPQFPRFLQGNISPAEVLVDAGYLAVLLVSIIILSRIIYRSELAAGRVKRRVKLFE